MKEVMMVEGESSTTDPLGGQFVDPYPFKSIIKSIPIDIMKK
jgi:hypothetical protein